MKSRYVLWMIVGALAACAASAKDEASRAPGAASVPSETEKIEPGKADQKQAAGNNKKENNKREGEKSDSSLLHHVDFIITGTDCPVCIDRMSLKMRKVPGVKKAAIFRFAVTNYGAVVYDAKTAHWRDIVESVADEHVGFENVKDLPLPKEETRPYSDGEKSSK
jgi:hypothetical protein